MSYENPMKHEYFVNLDQIEYLIQKTNNKFYWIFNNEMKYIKHPLLKDTFEKYFRGIYPIKNYKPKLILQILKMIENYSNKKENNHLHFINENLYYPLQFIFEYIGMEYALQFLNITYIIPEECLKNSKTEKIKYLSVKHLNINQDDIKKLDITDQLNKDTIYRDIMNEIFTYTISNMINKRLFLDMTISKLYKKWDVDNNIQESLDEYLKSALQNMDDKQFIKYIWLDTIIKQLQRPDKNLYIIYCLIERLIEHKYILMKNNITYFQISNKFESCQNNTFKILQVIDKKINSMFRNIFGLI